MLPLFLRPAPAARTLRVVAALAVVAAAAAPASAQKSFRVFSSLYDEFDVTPGAEYAGRFDVLNESDGELTLQIQPKDIRAEIGRGLAVMDPGAHDRSNAEWLVLDADIVTVQPGERRPVFYRVAVPAGVGDGSHWSALQITTAEAPRAALPESDRLIQASVGQSVFVYVQVVTHVGEAASEIAFLTSEVAESDGKPVLDLHLQNDGDRSDVVEIWAELYGADGELATRIEGSSRVMHPGTAIRQALDLSGVAPGTYSAIVVAEPSYGDAFGLRTEITL